ncbi:MAG: hypothetical protein N2110_02175 [Flavobacteriales bacterium]|nr:hypothetical protein [Flavobacteriales bacterium]
MNSKKALSLPLGFILLLIKEIQGQPNYYRTAASGRWNVISTWQHATNINGPWNPATTFPTATNSDTIIIRNGHLVRNIANVTVDQVFIEAGGTLRLCSAAMTFANGPGTDILVDGTLMDSSSTNTVFNTGARWRLGSYGTYIKTSGSSAVVWRDNYEGGISNIPATANWRIQKTGTQNPSVATVGGMHYPNLFIENFTTSMYTPAVAGYFQGSSDYPRIKGNFDVGGSGTGTVTFTVDVTHPTRIPVEGNFIVRNGNILRLWGNGFDIRGNITVDGTVLYDHDHGRIFELSGSNNQTISGNGIFKIWNLRINKTSASNTVTLLRPLTVDNQLEFVNGKIVSSASNKLIFNVYASHTGATSSSHVVGPVQKVGNAAFEFPVGKNNIFRPIAIMDSTAFVWFEDFGTGCSTGTEANGFSSPNGTWTVTNTGPNETMANVWYVSAEEQIGTGRCGEGCGGNNNRTLHLSTHPLMFGDLGASYFESSSTTCSFLGWCAITNKRVESPTINLTGYSNITLSFDYIEFGEGSNDNATLWYFNGTSWILLEDLPKTNCCGGVCNGSLQGGFVRYHVSLPATANNNPNVRIGFNWTNNGNGTGTDPSFAVDNILLTADAFTAEFFRANPSVAVGAPLSPGIDSVNSCEYWILDRDYGNASKTVRLSWGSGSCPTPNLPLLLVARWDGTNWVSQGNGGTTGSPTSGTILSFGPVSSFSPFSIGHGGTPLPVVMGPVHVECSNSQSPTLTWTTWSEMNSHYFDVQCSRDLLAWTPVGQVEAAGFSNAPRTYSFAFESFSNEEWYARLAQVDFNGETTFYGPWALNCPDSGSHNPSLTPNPGRGAFLITLQAGSYSPLYLELRDLQGRLIHSQSLSCKEDFCTIPVNVDVPVGLYSVSVLQGGAYLFTTKWVNLGY